MTTRTSGFTLVETIVAIGILGLVVTAVVTLLVGVTSAQRRNRAIAEVESQGTYVLYQFAQSARNSTTVSFPATSSIATTLKLTSAVSAENPTFFGFSGTQLAEKRGALATTTLTNSAVTVSSLSFQNLSASGTKGAVRISFTLTYVNPANTDEQTYSEAFYTTVTLR